MDVNHTIQTKLKPLPHDAIGKKMVTRIPTATKDQTIEEIQDLFWREARNLDLISYVYVVTTKGRIKGALSLHELFSKPVHKKVSEVMSTSIHKAHINTDQEKVAHMAVKNQLKAIPIVDGKDRLIGAVKTDQILQILDQESQEDLLKLTGFVLGKQTIYSDLSIPFYESYLRRVPWIVIGLLGGTFTASVVNSFSGVLAQDLTLAGFIPLVAYVTNAVGSQTQTIFIRELATNSNIKYVRYAIRQFLISFLIAATCWITVYILSNTLWHSSHIGNIVGTSISTAILVATFFSLSVPGILKKLRLDPAVGSGPFTTIIQDLLSVSIYFTVASLIL